MKFGARRRQLPHSCFQRATRPSGRRCIFFVWEKRTVKNKRMGNQNPDVIPSFLEKQGKTILFKESTRGGSRSFLVITIWDSLQGQGWFILRRTRKCFHKDPSLESSLIPYPSHQEYFIGFPHALRAISFRVPHLRPFSVIPRESP